LKLFVLGYPHNPSARVGDQEDLNRIMGFGMRHHLVIAHDNPYVDLALDGVAPSLLLAPGWRDWGVEFFSL
jgi:aspartate/methionine/tyrosine aminotransferase